MEHQISQTVYQSPAGLLGEEPDLKVRGELDEQQLRLQNLRFIGTSGISENNHGSGFVPAFYNTRTGISVISRFSDGQPAPVHILDGLPRQWILSFDSNGAIARVREGVIAGFIRAGRFYTREEAVLAH